MILAVLEKGPVSGLAPKTFSSTGGISVDDPAIDLAVVAAILSSNEDIPVIKVLFCRRVGLSEIRPVNRVTNASGSRKIRLLDHFVSKYNKISLKKYG
jgi:DNA repair protein RadA/Sms